MTFPPEAVLRAGIEPASARGPSRTDTGVTPREPESRASANSATRAGRPRKLWYLKRCTGIYSVCFRDNAGRERQISTRQTDEVSAELEAVNIVAQYRTQLRYAKPRRLFRVIGKVGIRPWPDVPGVYAVAGIAGFVKIGRAKSIARRLINIQSDCPVEVQLLAVLSTDPNDEERFHEMFAFERVRGEWFRASDRLLSYLDEARNAAA